MDKTALEPRLGVAWKPWGSQTTVIRGGYAIFHDSSWNQGAQGLWQNPPYYAESDALCVSAAPALFATRGLRHEVWPDAHPALSVSAGISASSPRRRIPLDFTGTLLSQNTNFKQGRVQQFNVNVEHQFPGQVVLTAGYAGSRASHILVDGNNLNVGSPCGLRYGSGLHAGLRSGRRGVRRSGD